MSRKTVTVKQVRSSNNRDKRTRATLLALGLGRIGYSRTHELTPATGGMIKSIQHLVEVHEGKRVTSKEPGARQGKE